MLRRAVGAARVALRSDLVEEVDALGAAAELELHRPGAGLAEPSSCRAHDATRRLAGAELVGPDDLAVVVVLREDHRLIGKVLLARGQLEASERWRVGGRDRRRGGTRIHRDRRRRRVRIVLEGRGGSVEHCPSTVADELVVLSPAAVVVVALSSAGAVVLVACSWRSSIEPGMKLTTGRKRSSAVSPTSSSARSWFFTPGSWTTTLPP